MTYSEKKKINLQAYRAKKDQPCMDCKLRWHPAIMTLDHRDRGTKWVSMGGRRMNPNNMMTYDVEAFAAMLKACDSVCMNCHSIREMKRDGQLYREHWLQFTEQLTDGALLIENPLLA